MKPKRKRTKKVYPAREKYVEIGNRKISEKSRKSDCAINYEEGPVRRMDEGNVHGQSCEEERVFFPLSKIFF